MPLAVGCFALLLAALLPGYVYPRLAVLPPDPQLAQVQEGRDGTVMVVDTTSPAGAREVTGVDVRVVTYVSAATADPPAGTVVWRLATTTTARGHGLVNARVETVSLDAHTAEPVNCCGDKLVTEEDDPKGERIRHSGYVAWPFDVQKRAYQVWDVQLNRSRTAAFIGEETHDGFRTYRFEAVTPLETIGTQVLPGALFGSRKPSVTAETQYQDSRTFWIEPATGNVIDIHEKLLQRFSYGGRTVTAIRADLDSPPISGDLRKKTEQGALILPWLRGRASVVLVLLGLGLIGLWGYRTVRRSDRRAMSPSASRWTSSALPPA